MRVRRLGRAVLPRGHRERLVPRGRVVLLVHVVQAERAALLRRSSSARHPWPEAGAFVDIFAWVCRAATVRKVIGY